MADARGWKAALAFMAGASALAVAGCAGTHVGDDWQCPAAQGSVCTSVGAADPAVPEVPQPWDPVHRAVPSGRESAAREPACVRGCDPLGWLAALVAGVGGGDGVDGSGPSVSGEASDAGVARLATPGPDPSLAEGGGPLLAGNTEPTGMAGPDPETTPPAQLATAPEVGGGAESGADAASLVALKTPFGDNPREPEAIGRVWIAPYVDADGIYREASWVRVVIAPARWRLP